jgi:hypothetical protein
MTSRAQTFAMALGFLVAWLTWARPVHAETRSCSTITELECLHSAECTLVPTEQRGKYTCRASVGHCEIGFAQEGEGDIKQQCEARPGCEFQPGSCFCPPDKVCVCGGGPPAQCVESGKAAQR